LAERPTTVGKPKTKASPTQAPSGGRQTPKPKFNEFNISKTADGPAPLKWSITSMDAGAQKTKQNTKGSQTIAAQGGQAETKPVGRSAHGAFLGVYEPGPKRSHYG
jgi:hypothetical protein